MRKASDRDIPAICNIFQTAKESLAAAGVDQWQQGYPNADSVKADIAANNGYVMDFDGTPIGYMMLRDGEEAAYEHIFDGHWLAAESRPYLTIHRIAVDTDQKQKGVAKMMVDEATAIAAQKSCSSLRVDTHQDNRPMRRFLEKQGFVFCGKIRLLEGPEAGNLRLCYEKSL